MVKRMKGLTTTMFDKTLPDKAFTHLFTLILLPFRVYMFRSP